ncbi:laccase T2 copper depleted [Stereum hirsutum FP-91666 SS1]|uniref:laccase T2 copper depleted n=1 Tax=Stereum hirsutum (strain FP-91666) TaxID=721885 RepID=UPI000441043B|nr:laccase T2 copper depleted [Stereum hirsutum FP-91666 SS1]EIM87797.1 laccase T2 copper depleted [Stereum hirsutum FP-91666 SS1]
MANIVLPLSSLLLAAGAMAAIGPVTDLQITNVELAPDGYTRDTVSAGSVFPGPLITGNMGDTFQINVIDELSDSNMLKTTSVHWHGLFQSGTTGMDAGVAFVSECPIAPNNSFTYDFSVPDQAGTFWYHSHLSTQYCDGLRGPMVIYDPNDPHASLYDVDDDTTILTLADWYHVFAPDAGLVPTADATLINGLGRYADGPASDLAVITVESGKRYRMRMINMACDPNYTFSIDGHTMTIIEADGVNVDPLGVDSIQIFAGQRYSFVLEANQTVDNYWVRALPSAGTTSFDGGLNMAILRYSGADEIDPTTNQTTSTMALAETDLHTLGATAVAGTAEQGGADVNLNLAVAFDATALQFTVNDVPFTPPTVPVLLQILSGSKSVQELLPSGSIYTVERNKTIEVSIPAGAAGGPHPLHLHGHVFDVIRSAGSDTYNYVNPVQRDVVSMGVDGDNVTIRFTTDNPGPWILHCHIDWHLEAGFGIVFAEDVNNTASANVDTSAWDDLCPIYDGLTSDQL